MVVAADYRDGRAQVPRVRRPQARLRPRTLLLGSALKLVLSAWQETHGFGLVEGVIWVWRGTLSTQDCTASLFWAVLRLWLGSVLGLRTQFFR